VKREVTAEELERPLVAYRDAVERILAGFEPRAPERVPISDALGLVLAEDVVAGLDVPGFDNSAMDGFAIRSSDTQGAKPVVLRLVDDLPAGSDPRITVEPGTAATIMTGAPLPPGADAVVPWEDTERREDEVAVLVEIAPGRHVRPRGEDVRAGDTVIASGATLGPVHVGVIASLGITHVRAVPRPRVAVLSSGDELVPPGGKLMPGQVFDANRAVITALCEREGVTVVAEALLPDEPDVMTDWLNEVAAKADLVVTTGGASVGEHDWIRAILEKEGALELWRVAIKPGKPIAFGRIAGTPVLALPGNPGSAFVGMHVFVLPALRKLAGRDPTPRSVQARLGGAVKGSPSRTLFCRVRLDGELAHPLEAQSSVVLSNLLPTEGFAVVPPGGLAEGADVTVELL
jgi:molybdopterin molybdotransferase